MDPHIQTRISQTNPWLTGGDPVREARVARLPTPWIPRRQVRTGTLLTPTRAHLIVGPRQAGKSTLAWSILRELERPLYLNMEEPVLRAWCGSPAQFLSDLEILGPAPTAVFLEEAQWLPNAALFVKGLVDAKVEWPIIVTGSASFQLHDQLRESLAGRADRQQLLPFSLSEVADTEDDTPLMRAVRRREALTRMVRVGGFPDAWLADSPATVLGELVQAFVLRDASDLFKVERLDAFSKLLELTAHQVGNLTNQSEFASVCGVAVGTVSRYLALMEEAHLVHQVPAFAGGKRREVTTARKSFYVDNGLRNAVLSRADLDVQTAPDRGALYENWVYTELIKALPWSRTVRYWRSSSGAEVDFVVEGPPGLLGIEVKASALRRPKLSRSSRSFIEAYAPTEFWVLNSTLDTEQRIGDTRVRWRPFIELPDDITPWV